MYILRVMYYDEYSSKTNRRAIWLLIALPFVLAYFGFFMPTLNSIVFVVVIYLVIWPKMKKKQYRQQLNAKSANYTSSNSEMAKPVPVNYNKLETQKNNAYCYECGATLSTQVKFCAACGTSQTL